MGYLSAVCTYQIEQGFDAIDRAATIADVVASVAVRGRDGVPGVGILSNYALTATTETALRIATAMGFRAHRLAVRSPLGHAIADAPDGDDMLAEFDAELDHPAATFHVIEAYQGDDAVQRTALLVGAIAAKRPTGARTSILIAVRDDVDAMTFTVARALRMDPDDVTVRIF